MAFGLKYKQKRNNFNLINNKNGKSLEKCDNKYNKIRYILYKKFPLFL